MPRKKRKSSVNISGNYTKPALRKRIFNRILAANIQGTAAGKWSARKAQLLAKRYKKAGGGYSGEKEKNLQSVNSNKCVHIKSIIQKLI